MHFFYNLAKIGFFDEYSYLCKDVMLIDVNNMRTKRYVILLFLAVFCFSGCAELKKIKEIEVDNFRVEAVSPNGLRGLTVNFVVEVDNPASQLSFSDVTGTLERSGKVLGRVEVDPFTLQGKRVEKYHLKADVTLGEGASILELGKLIDKNALNESTVDINAKVKIKNGAPKKIKLNDVPLKELLNNVKK